MSTAIPKGASAQAPLSKAAVPPVPILNNAVAAGVSFAHPALLAALFAWRFGALVADPVYTLWTALPVVVAIQAIYAVLCLPIAGSQSSRAAKKARPGEKKRQDATGPNPIVTAVLSLLLTVIVTPALYVLFILFGAPFLTHVPHTFLCCAHLAILAVFPVFYVRGVEEQLLRAVLGAAAPLDETFGGFAGAVVGAWLGAVPIPLDWDREWQKWPVTIVVGVYLGYVLGAKVLGKAFYGKRWVGSEDTTKEE